jgi:hypothetical protein
MAGFLASSRSVSGSSAVIPLVATGLPPLDGGVTGSWDEMEPGDSLDSPEDLLVAVGERRDRAAFARLFDVFAARL